MATDLGRVAQSVTYRLQDYVGTIIANRELRFVGVILFIYSAIIATLYVLVARGIVDEGHFVSLTVSTSCFTFLTGQIALLTRAKKIEQSVKLKGTLVSLFEEAGSSDECIVKYIAVGNRTAEVILESKLRSSRGSSRALLDFSNIAIETCHGELEQMLKRQRIERSGNLAYKLTRQCYNFATDEISAVALTYREGLDFWSDTEGIGRHFYGSNQAAIARGVRVRRYFYLPRSEARLLKTDRDYKAKLAKALNTYVKQLPSSEVYLAFRKEDWRNLFPSDGIEDDLARANDKFKDYYTDKVVDAGVVGHPGSFPDVSLFDKSVASLWRGASKNRIDTVRIAWEPFHVKCVKHLFKSAFSSETRALVMARQPNQTVDDLVETFARALPDD